ncbi:MAG: hypothetical protein PHV34_16910 [Verrucomicrobiae bacterium]|nr:hypothetical protein [Verrucomicrobiae bacterium]
MLRYGWFILLFGFGMRLFSPVLAEEKPLSQTPGQPVAEKVSAADQTEGIEEIVKVGEKRRVQAGRWKELLSKEVPLTVPLLDVVALVVLVNVLALFKLVRFILLVSYLFCLKWVFWSNYAQVFQESKSISDISMWIFLVCGLLTGALFFMDHFRRD